MSTESRPRVLLARLALVPLGLLLGLLLLEGTLQLAALALRISGRELAPRFVTCNLRILCLGDSNTYGLYLDREQAYPPQLERLWNESGRTPRIEVINMGFPGTNTSRLRRELPRMLETFAPDLVIAMIGVNDFWTVPVPLDDADSPGARERVARRSRVYRGIRMLRRAFGDDDLEVILDPAWVPKERAANRARFGDEECAMGCEAARGEQGERTQVTAALVNLVALARSHDTPLVMMSYPSRFKMLYPFANAAIRGAAKRTGAPLIDLTAVFEPLCPEEEFPELLFEDQHPTERGHRVVAETIATRLPELFPETLREPGSAGGPPEP